MMKPTDSSNPNLKCFIIKHWNGEYSLARSYWVHLVLGSGLVILVTLPLMLFLQAAPPRVFATSFWLLLLLALCWQAWAMKGVWSAASKSTSPSAPLAKLMILLHAASLVVLFCREPEGLIELWHLAVGSQAQ